MLRKVLSLFVFVLFFAGLAHAQENERYVYFFGHTVEGTVHSFAYEIRNIDMQEHNFNVQFEARNSNGTYMFSCSKNVSYDVSTISKKVVCDTPLEYTGSLLLTVSVYENEKLLDTTLKTFQFYKGLEQKISFTVKNGVTLVELQLDGVGENVVVTHSIPKSVIPKLTAQNHLQYIESSRSFDIVNSDPVIAWNIEKLPATVNYTIKKEVSIQDQQEFSVSITQSPSFIWFKMFLFVLIVGVILLLFVSKKSKRK